MGHFARGAQMLVAMCSRTPHPGGPLVARSRRNWTNLRDAAIGRSHRLHRSHTARKFRSEHRKVVPRTKTVSPPISHGADSYAAMRSNRRLEPAVRRPRTAILGCTLSLQLFTGLCIRLAPPPPNNSKPGQLRALWHRYRIVVTITDQAPEPVVDTPEEPREMRLAFCARADHLEGARFTPTGLPDGNRFRGGA